MRSAVLALTLAAAFVGSTLVGACGGATGSAAPGPPDGGAPDASTPVADSAAPSLCVNGVPAAYPAGGAGVGQTMPDVSFFGVDEAGAPKTLAMHDVFEPCASRSRLLVLRVGAEWCGTCRWHAGHTNDLLALDVGSRLEIVDVLIAGADNLPSRPEDIAPWRALVDSPRETVIDPTFSLGPITETARALPLFVVIDTRTMTMLEIQNDPDPDLFALFLRQDLAALDGAPKPAGVTSPTFDGRFDREQWDLIRGMGGVPGAPPPDPTNAHADDPSAAALGKQLFTDTSLSPSGTISCGKCHDAGQLFTDSLPQSMGVSKGDRNSPSVLFAAYAPRWQFWDGRADSLWAQATGPFENDKEFASSRLFVAHAMYVKYKSSYEAVFGAMPDLTDLARFPASGKPGDASWAAMAAADQTAITRVYVNVAKSIAAYERTLRAQPNALDAYAAGSMTALTDPQKNALKSFFQAGCAQCHYGPRLTDDAFHVTRFPTGRQDGAADRGRIDGIPLVLAYEFASDGAFSDAPTTGLAKPFAAPITLGAFKTPTLRGVASTAPYTHGGAVADLATVVKIYSTAGLAPDDTRAVGQSEPWLPRFDQPTQLELPGFLDVLTAAPAP